MPADTAILPLGDESTPALVEIPGALEFVMRAVYASFDGTSAASSFVPALQLLTASGEVAGTWPLDSTIAAGGSADVSWFPGVKVTTGGAGTSVKTTNTGGTVTVDPTSELLIGTNLTLTNPSTGVAELVAFDGKTGIFYDFANIGGYLDVTTQSTDASGYGFNIYDESGGNSQIASESTLRLAGGSIGPYIDVDDTTGGVLVTCNGTGGYITFHLGFTNGIVRVLDNTGAAIFEVRNDGSLHGKTGQSLTFDL